MEPFRLEEEPQRLEDVRLIVGDQYAWIGGSHRMSYGCVAGPVFQVVGDEHGDGET
jgi:hypothetical protein